MCPCKMKANISFNKETKPKKNSACKYTLDELIRLNQLVTNSYLTSQINIYRIDCNRFNRQIDELFSNV